MSGKTIIIAEAGVNHNGDLDLAVELVDHAARSGADAVKFQTFQASKLASASTAKADYQKVTTDADESQLDMLRRLELSKDAHGVLVDRCAEKGIAFLSSAFDLDSLAFLSGDLRLETLKLGSGHLTNAPMLLGAARTGMALLVSTGMGTLAEVEEALGVIAFGLLRSEAPASRKDFAGILLEPAAWSALKERVTLLHCTTEYPAAMEDTNLHAMDTMRRAFGLSVGYSDHTEGATVSLAAVALGAAVIEKHFTLDRNMPGPDHAASLEPDEMKALVEGIRNVERALGDGIKRPGPAEVRNRAAARCSVVAVRDLPQGEIIGARDITAKRPGTGLSAMSYWDCLNRRIARPVAADAPLSPEDLAWAE